MPAKNKALPAEADNRKLTDSEMRRVARVLEILIRVDQRKKQNAAKN
jgi:hypothetical protein